MNVAVLEGSHSTIDMLNPGSSVHELPVDQSIISNINCFLCVRVSTSFLSPVNVWEWKSCQLGVHRSHILTWLLVFVMTLFALLRLFTKYLSIIIFYDFYTSERHRTLPTTARLAVRVKISLLARFRYKGYFVNVCLTQVYVTISPVRRDKSRESIHLSAEPVNLITGNLICMLGLVRRVTSLLNSRSQNPL